MEILEVVTIGFPFCCFKILSGLSGAGLSRLLGGALVALGLLDLLINGLNLLGLLFLRRRLLDACVLSVVSRIYGRWTSHPESLWRDFGNSLDVFVSFVLVAAMVGSGALNSFGPSMLGLWNACVVFNVLGAGMSRMGSSLRSFQ